MVIDEFPWLLLASFLRLAVRWYNYELTLLVATGTFQCYRSGDIASRCGRIVC